MKPLHALLSLVPTVLCAASSIHMAVIDEEMAAVLPQLIAQDPERPVLVVERGRCSTDDLLLEREFSYYDEQAPLLVTRDAGLDATPERFHSLLERLCSQVADSLLDIPQGQATRIPCVPSKLGSEPALSIYLYNAEGVDEEVSYLVRLPEMGLQPGLVGGCLAPILDALVHHELTAGNTVEFFLLGCGGGVDPDYAPGAVGDIGGSLYLGVDYIEGEDGPYFQARIELRVDAAEVELDADHLIYAGRQHRLDVEAQANPVEQRKVYKQARQELHDAQENILSDAEALANLEQLVASVREETGRDVSLTTSFFCGAGGKQLGASVGIHSVNMEDHQLIGVVNALRQHYAAQISIPRFDLRRQVEDPAEINPSLNERFLRHLKGTSYPPTDYPQMARSSYLDALCWALLHNRDYHCLPQTANWTFAWQQLAYRADLEDHFYSFDAEWGPCILDPFFAEIASDMLSEMLKGHFLTPYMIDVEVHRETKAHALTRLLLQRELQAANQRIAAHAAWALSTARVLAARPDLREEEARFRRELNDLLDEIAYLGGEKTPCLLEGVLPAPYRELLADPVLRAHFVPSSLGPEDLQTQLGFRNIDPELLRVLPTKGGTLRQLDRLNKAYLLSFDRSSDALLQEHLDEMNDRIQLRKLALDAGHASLNDLYVMIKLVYQLAYPLPRIGFFVKRQASLDQDCLDVWTRPGKWFSNLTGFANHLPYDYLVSDHGFEAGSRHALLRALNQIMGQVELQDSILDRALYKSTLEPALLAVAKEHVARSQRSVTQEH